MICDTPQKASILIGNVEKDFIPGLKMIILMDPFEDDLKERGEKSGIEILSFYEAEVIVCLKLKSQIEGWGDTMGSLQDIYTGVPAAALQWWQETRQLDSCCETWRIISPRQLRNVLGDEKFCSRCAQPSK